MSDPDKDGYRTLVSKVNGKVDKLYVAPGDRVNTEDLLISFVLDEEEEK